MDQLIEETGLAVILKENELSETESSDILEKFSEIEAIAADWKKKAQALEVTREDQVAEMKMAREGRLFLQKKRTAVENTRKDMKAEYLKKGRAIDEVAKYLKGLIEPIEEDLERKEKFAERLHAERQLKKQAERMARLEPYNLAVEPGMIGSMTDQMFESYIKGVDADAKAEAERAQKEEEERLERERINNLHHERKEFLLPYWQFVPEAFKALNMGMATEMEFRSVLEDAKKAKDEHDAEQERIRQENEKLKQEAEKAKEAALAKEKAEQEAREKKVAAFESALVKNGYQKSNGVWKKDQYSVSYDRLASLNQKEFDDRLKEVDDLIAAAEEKARIAAELQAKRDAEERQRLADEAKAKQEAEALKKAEKAPDRDKLANWVNNLALPEVTLKSADAQATAADIRTKFEAFKAWALKQTEAL